MKRQLSAHILRQLIVLLPLYILFYSFIPESKGKNEYCINLRRSKAYENQKWWNERTGLLWSLSLIGATLPKGEFDNAISFSQDSTLLTIDFSRLGFTAKTLLLIAQFNNDLKASEEYKRLNSVDIGRWLVYVIHTDNHYYQLVDAPATFEEFKQQHPQTTGRYLIDNSSVSLGMREINFYVDSNLSKQFFIATEGNYNSQNQTFTPTEFETIDLLPNSQPRFAIYGRDGKLLSKSDTLLSKAGRIGKCMWCHESKIEPLFTNTKDVAGYATREQYEAIVQQANRFIYAERKKQKTDLNWFEVFEHTQAELLYISFMQRSVSAIAKEWNLPIAEVEQIFHQLPTSSYDEFPYLGSMHPRSRIDSLAPFKVIKMPVSVRE